MTLLLLDLSQCANFSSDIQMHKISLTYKIWTKFMFCFVYWALAIVVGTLHCKIFFLGCGFQYSEQKKKAVSTPEKQSRLYYISGTCQRVLWRHFFSATACSKQLARLSPSNTFIMFWKLICRLLGIRSSIN